MAHRILEISQALRLSSDLARRARAESIYCLIPVTERDLAFEWRSKVGEDTFMRAALLQLDADDPDLRHSSLVALTIPIHVTEVGQESHGSHGQQPAARGSAR